MEQGGLARAGGTIEGGCRVAALEIDREREVGQFVLYIEAQHVRSSACVGWPTRWR